MEPMAWHVLALQMVTFVAGAGALWFIALKPIRRVMEERRRRIEAEYKAGNEARRLAESLEGELRRKMAKLEEEMHQRAKRAEEASARLQEDARGAAKGEARRILEQARVEMRRERARMRGQFRAEVASMAVKMAVRVTGKMIGAKERKRLVERVIAELPAAFSAGRAGAREHRPGKHDRGREAAS